MTTTLLQRQTEAMWRAVADARQGKTAAYLLLDGMARWNPPSERLKKAALRNAISAMVQNDVLKKKQRQRMR
jgi:DnaJ-domain-containing protein 1